MKANRYTYLLPMLICICLGVRSGAQGVCASSALVPVFSETFGTSAFSTTKTTTPAGFTTNYAFNGLTSLADGQYMVTPLVQNSLKNDWAVGGDHTGNANGNMYLINAGRPASGPVDLFFSKQVDNLCPGSVYSFSAWLLNANTTSNTVGICGAGIVLPKVTFNIKNTSGFILQTYTTTDLPLTPDRVGAPNWLQYGFQFTLPAGTTSLILEMRDFYGGQASYCGNDLAIDDILFSACAPTATAAFSTASSICSGSSTSINCSLVNSPYSTPAYQWQKSTDNGVNWSNIGTPGTSASSYSISNATATDGAVYRVLVGPDVASLSSATCVTSSNSVTLTIYALPSLSVGSNSPVCTGSNLSLSSTPAGGLAPYTYAWSGPSFTSTSAAPVITNVTTAANAGMYVLTVTDSHTCKATASTNVTIPALPSTSNAGADQVLCNVSSATLNAVAPASGTGSWTQVGGPNTAVFVNALLRN
ncbi:MAG: hypothetical protein JWQ30_1733, partial [Sediminibacterium sp.]|nr:hypothetical protein [Sediminibacterium sp.]